MSECAECGAPIADDHNFCTACGARVPVPAGAAPTPWGSYVATPATTAPAPDYRPPGSGYAPPGEPYPVPPYLPPQNPAVRKGLLIALGVIVGLFVLLNIAAALDPVEDDAPTYDYDDIDFSDDFGDGSAEWITYKDPDGEFYAQFPVEPVATVNYGQPLPDVEPQDATYVVADTWNTFVVASYDLSFEDAGDSFATAAEAASWYAATVGGEVASSQDVTSVDYVAHDVDIKFQSGNRYTQGRVRAVVHGMSLIILAVLGDSVDTEFERAVAGFEPVP